MTGKLFLIAGSVSASLSVALGAAAMHGLQALLQQNDPNAWFGTALQYHQLHSVALLMVGLLIVAREPNRWLTASGLLFLIGLLLFCANLYLRATLGWHIFHGLVPLGGAAFILGWLSFAVAATRLSTPIANCKKANRT